MGQQVGETVATELKRPANKGMRSYNNTKLRPGGLAVGKFAGLPGGASGGAMGQGKGRGGPSTRKGID